MATPVRRKRSIPRRPSVDADVIEQVAEYLQNRSMRERSEHFEGQLKRALMHILETAGEQVEEHRQTITLDTPLPYVQYKNGKPIQKTVIGIERRERVSNRLDEEKALKFLEAKGLTEECTIPIVVVDEDAILAANYVGKITDKELAALYNESSTFAFYPTEESA